MVHESELEYAGFWRRFGATLIDAVLLFIVTFAVINAVYGADYWLDERRVKGPMDFLISWVLPAVVVLVFWTTKGATPGKMAITAQVVDERTGGKPTTGQLVRRYFAYFVSTLPFCLGFMWVGFDPKKQGWQDKLSGTVVVRLKAGSTEPVRFQQSRFEPSRNSLGPKMRHIVPSLMLLATAVSAVSFAQTLPTPSRTVFKCNVNGKTTYSDSPCLGAERLEIEPSRGVGKTAGPDIQRERRREMFAEAIRPLTGMDAKQLDVQGRRMKLSTEAQRECRGLDTKLPETERVEARASGDQRDLEKTRLLTLRQRQRDLRC